MKCPVDDTLLVMSDRNGIEIDYCPQCRGVWLDRGELDKVIERSAAAPQTQERTSYQERPQLKEHYRETKHYDYDDDDYRHGHNKKRRKESFLGDLFDF